MAVHRGDALCGVTGTEPGLQAVWQIFPSVKFTHLANYLIGTYPHFTHQVMHKNEIGISNRRKIESITA